MVDLSRAQCAYCTKRAHTTEWEGDAEVPVCKAHHSDVVNGPPNPTESDESTAR